MKFFKRNSLFQSINSQTNFCYLAFLFFIFFVFCSHPLQAKVENLVPVVISKLPHSLPAFTQGLAIEDDKLYESTGLYGQSSIRILDISTGKILHSIPLTSKIFAEGIAVFPSSIVQITWREHRALVYNRHDLKLEKILSYTGDGWGLCRDGSSVWMSNGSSQLIHRNSTTFSPLKTLDVRLNGVPLESLNDLECVDRHLYANVWQKNWIVRIDKSTGIVDGLIDASTLLSHTELTSLGRDHVLNGIAYRPKTGTFFITGKEWPWIFEVRFVSSHEHLGRTPL